MTQRTCALCGWRDSVGVTDYDHRTVPACGVCLKPPPDPTCDYEPADLLERAEAPSEATSGTFATRDAIVFAIRAHGSPATTSDVLRALGVGAKSRAASAVSHQLGRMVRRGELSRAWIRPGDPKGGGLYTVLDETPTVRDQPGEFAQRKVLEAIEAEGEVRIAPLAKRLGVKRCTVARALAALSLPLKRVRRGVVVAWVYEGAEVGA